MLTTHSCQSGRPHPLTYQHLGSQVKKMVEQRLISNRDNPRHLTTYKMFEDWINISTPLEQNYTKAALYPSFGTDQSAWKWQSDLSKLSTFHTKSPRRIWRLFLPIAISNQDLLDWCQQEEMTTLILILRRHWNWLGHVLRRDSDSIITTALFWTSEENGREKGLMSANYELKEQKRSWDTLQKLASDRHEQRIVVTALYVKGVTCIQVQVRNCVEYDWFV